MKNIVEIEKGLIAIIATASQVRPENASKIWEKSQITASDFSMPALGELWDVIGGYVQTGEAVDVLAVFEKLKLSPSIKSAGGQKFIAEILMGVAPSRHISDEYVRLIQDASLRRRAAETVNEAIKALASEKKPVQEVLDFFSDAWQALTKRVQGLRPASQDVLNYCDQADQAFKGSQVYCHQTGIEALDKQIGGLQASVLTMVGAFPGVGKSALLATIVYNLAKSGVKVGFFSLEDERLWVTRRWLSLLSGVPLFNITMYRLNEYQQANIAEAAGVAYKLLGNVVIDDRQGLTPAEVTASAKDMILNHGCKVIIVDHLGEMRLERSDRYDLDIADALAGLRDIAKRHQLPVVVASHVRRRQGLTVDDAPSLTDFANSSAPERMARVALGLSKVSGGIRCTILKQTNGPSGAEIGLKLVEHAAMVSNTETVDVGGSNE